MKLIDADVAIEELTDRSHQAAKRVGTDSPFWEGLVIARRIVNNLPTIQPEPHEGRFERKQDGIFCSVCHYGWEFITGVPAEVEREYRYCPNCGADMRGEKDG